MFDGEPPVTKAAATHDPLDVSLGARLRFLRRGVRLSQEAVAEKVGVTFQQIQKYENGKNRISFSMLVAFARALGMTPAELIGDVGKPDGEGASAPDLEFLASTALLHDVSRLSPRDRNVVTLLVRTMLREPEEDQT